MSHTRNERRLVARVLAVIAPLAILMLMSPLDAQTTRPLNGFSGGSSTDWLASNRGYEFEILSTPVTVTELGGYSPGMGTDPHEVTLFQFNGTGLGWSTLASVTTTPGSGWRWETLATPISLQMGERYRVTVATQSGTGAGFYETSTAPSNIPSEIDYKGVAWRNVTSGTASPHPGFSSLGGGTAGYADIGYTTAPAAAEMTVTPANNPQAQVLDDAQGPGGIGVEAGEFELSTNAGGSATLTSIDLTASGSGDDSTAFSEVQIYQDDPSSGTVGSYDAADTPVSTTTGNFTADDGTITFNVDNVSQSFAASESRTFFVVVKLAGTAQVGDTFRFTVSDIDVGSTNKNVPNTEMPGLIIEGPTMTISPVAGTPQSVVSTNQGPGGNGIQAAEFEISVNSLGDMSILEIDLTASGSGDDSTAYSSVEVYRDDGNGSYDAADVSILASPVNFTGDDGTTTLNVVSSQQDILASETRTYFIVVKLDGTALPGDTFDFNITGVTVSGGNDVVTATTMEGLIIVAAEFLFSDASPSTPETAYLASDGNVCQEFTIEYPEGPDDKPTLIEIAGLGTADEATDLVDVELWHDSDLSGDFDSQLDSLIDTKSYGSDDGTISFDFSSGSDFMGGDLRRYFVVYNLNADASDGETFKCYVSGASGMSNGGAASGLPTPGASGTEGLVVSDSLLRITSNGPVAALDVDSDSTGTTGDGELLYDVTLEAGPADDWTVTDLTFQASGTGDADSAFSEVALYEDDGNGTWDGAGTDPQAANIGNGFTAGTISFTLNSTTLAAGTSKRYFLTVKLNGSALSGETFNASLDSMNVTAPTGGDVVGLPATASTALVIDLASLTVSAAPNQPTPEIHNAGSSGDYLIAGYRMAAMNDVVSVNGITLTTDGSGDWVSDIDGTAGVQVYHDDGDGVFDDASDTLMFEGAGGATVNAAFTGTVSVQQHSHEDLWVRIRLTATAGIGAAATPDTFSLEISQPTDVNASANVVLGTPAPTSIEIGAIEFAVTSFTPVSDVPAGGAAITIEGSGFMAPFIVRIDGVDCIGTPIITGGTEVTGISVPPGSGEGVPIEIFSGNLPPQTIAPTFDYKIDDGTGTNGNNGGCSTSDGGVPMAPLWAVILGLVVAFFVPRVRRQVK